MKEVVEDVQRGLEPRPRVDELEAKVAAMREKALVWKKMVRAQCKEAWEASLDRRLPERNSDIIIVCK
jgi:hypothetical protein|tara:strand:- start:281 stop:484 length:204 start_codon:yes stop_codon:yes gene_type:complete